MNSRGAQFQNPNITPTEVCAEGVYNNKRIGIESEGDPKSQRFVASLQQFEQIGCEAIICASRRKYPTKQEVLNYRANGYSVIETSHYFYKQSDTLTTGTNLITPTIDLNKLYAKAIVDLIDVVIK